ncbi:MAG: hypothetical protein ACM31D_15100 [Bacteroidota bacterium]
MKGSRSRINDRNFAKHRRMQEEQAAEALDRNLSHIAGQIVSSSTTPSEAVLACQMVSRIHSLDEDSTWRLIEKVMVFFHEKCSSEHFS